MTIVVGTNSYVTEAEADTYFLSRVGGDIWAGLDPTQKEQALLSAMPYLESYCDWYGYKTDPEQALEWPRNGETEVPQSIKNAQCEIALTVHNAGDAATATDTSAAIKRLKADTVEIEYMDSLVKTGGVYSDLTRVYLVGYCNPGTAQGASCGRVIRT